MSNHLKNNFLLAKLVNHYTSLSCTPMLYCSGWEIEIIQPLYISNWDDTCGMQAIYLCLTPHPPPTPKRFVPTPITLLCISMSVYTSLFFICYSTIYISLHICTFTKVYSYQPIYIFVPTDLYQLLYRSCLLSIYLSIYLSQFCSYLSIYLSQFIHINPSISSYLPILSIGIS